MISKISHIGSWAILILIILTIIAHVLTNQNFLGDIVSAIGWAYVIILEDRLDTE
jgi:hypothetical protein